MLTPGQTETGLARGGRRRQAILRAAAELIAEKGSHATTLAEIAGRAGVTRSGLLHHYPSKEALLAAVLDEHERVIEPIFELVVEPGGLASVAALVEISRGEESDPTRAALWSMLLSENTAPGPSSPLRPRLLAAYESYVSQVTAFLEQAEQSGELAAGVDKRAEAIEIIACLNGLASIWLLEPKAPLVPLVERYLERKLAELRA